MPAFKVVDLSHYNPTPDFATAKAGGVIGIVHKATQGATYVDPKYAGRVKAAKSAGLLWGAYHFGTGADVDAQLAQFLAVVQPDASTLVVRQ